MNFGQNVSLIISWSGSLCAVILRRALQGHHGPLVEEPGAPNCSIRQQVHVQGHRAWQRHFVCWHYVQYGPNSARETPAGPLKFMNPFLGKGFCNDTDPMCLGIVDLKNRTCSLVCSRLKDIINVILSVQSLSNHYKIKLVVMTKAAPTIMNPPPNILVSAILETDPAHIDAPL